MAIDKGIRPFCNAKFLELLPTRENTSRGNMKFRAAVRGAVIEEFSATDASASTHYNHAFQEARKLVADGKLDAKLLEGLGRPPEKNNGGRKKKVTEAAVQEQPPAAPDFVDAESIVQTEWKVCKKADDSVVAEGLSFEAAKEMVEAAKKAKRAKLYFV